MNVSITYPPLEHGDSIPLLSQNRQFQWFSKPTYIYPMVPAYAATMLKQAGHTIYWDDAISEDKNYSMWLKDIERAFPEIVVIETKTPVYNLHIKIIDQIKSVLPDTLVVLVGDHVTAFPERVFFDSKTDYVLTGGDYDFLLLNLVEYLSGNREQLEPGIWYMDNKSVVNTGNFVLNHDLNSLPFIDRELTKWKNYAFENGNYVKTPGTYTMVGRDCWWRQNGGCIFCSWTTLYPQYRVRRPELLVKEIEQLVDNYKVKEIFDDTGSFPTGSWLTTFCKLMIDHGYNEKVELSGNMRFGTLLSEDYKLMKKAGWRMLLFGLESGNQKTLDKLNKGIKVQDIIDGCKFAYMAGIDPHITVMIGYPWETKQEALKTLELSKTLMTNGWVKTLQSTIIIPYPGTKLFSQSLENDWFLIDPYYFDRYDMSEPVLNTPDMTPEEVRKICNDVYKIFLSPKYIYQRMKEIKSLNDFVPLIKGISKVLGHLNDFGNKRE